MKATLTPMQADARGPAAVLLPDHESGFVSLGGRLMPAPASDGGNWVRFTFSPRYSAWQVSSGPDVDLRVAGEAVRGSKLLTSGETLTVDGSIYRVDYECEPPVLDGHPVGSIPLEGRPELVVGRAADRQPGKLELDPHVLTISREHFKILRQADGTFLENRSDFGTEINSRVIQGGQKLVFGDRIKVGEYIFQFEGDQLRRIDHSDSGSVYGRDLTVVVKDRGTGQPKRILNEVTVGAKQGDFVGILGGSGQGKSTLLTALCGLRHATSGNALIGGRSSTTLNAEKPGAIGYVPQDDIVHLELTVESALYFSSLLRLKLARSERMGLIDRTLEILALTEHRRKRIYQLSGGQRKRVSIAIELLSKPEVLFLDEPSSGLDPSTENALMELLQALTLNNLTVICTTHVLQNAFLFDRLWYLHSGKLIFSGDAAAARAFFLEGGTQMTASHAASSITPRGQLERIYSTVLNGKLDADEWQRRFQASDAGQVEARFVESVAASAAKPEEMKSMAQPSALVKFAALCSRQAALLLASPLNLLFLASQVVIIGLLVAWVSDDFAFRNFLGIIAAMWFGCSNGAQEIVKDSAILARERLCGLGANTYALSKTVFQAVLAGAQALVLFVIINFFGSMFHPADFDPEHFAVRYAERNHPVIADERPVENEDDSWLPMEDMDEGATEEPMDVPDAAPEPELEVITEVPGPMLLWLAKVFELKENILDSGPKPLTMSDGSPVIGEDLVQVTLPGASVSNVLVSTIGLRILSYLCAALIGVAMGLAISAVVQTPIQAVMWVPLLLIPQILFGGFVINLPEMPRSVRKTAPFFPSFACQRLADVSYLYGRETPSLTNKTKTPQFLTTDGQKDEMEWEEGGRTLTQSFEKVSDVNLAWQNLLVEPELLGQHKHHRTPGARLGMYDYPESVSTRRDVVFDKGTSFLSLHGAMRPLITLVVCAVLCYLIIVINLWKRKSI
jgi:ABC-type multidrug transport system ATPase subunit